MILQEEKAITAGIFGFLALGLLGRMLLGALYRRLIRETDNMATTNCRALRQCKLKFTNCCQLGNGVSNVPVFVEKFLDHLTVGPFAYETIDHLAGQSVLLSVLCAGIGVCRGIMDGRSIGEILPYYIVSFSGLYLYFAVSAVIDLRMRRRMLKTNLVDYLENHLAARINVTDRDMEMLYGREKAVPDGAAEPRRGKRRTIEVMTFPTGKPREVPAQATEEELQELLKEFL